MKKSPLPALFASLLLLALWGTAVPARARLSDPGGSAGARDPSWFAARQALQGWWRGFRDEQIDSLVPAALRTGMDVPAPPRATQLVAVLIGLRESATQSVLASEQLALLQEQRRLAAASAPTREAVQRLAALDARLAWLRTTLRQHLQTRDAYLAAWTVLTGKGEAQRVALRADLSPEAVPAFDAPPPEQVSVALLMGRRDVAAAMADTGRWLRMAGGDTQAPAAQLLEGWVRASPTGLAPTSVSSEGDALTAALVRAGQELSRRLFALQSAQDELGRALAAWHARADKEAAAAARGPAGRNADLPEIALLEDRAQQLAEAGQLVTAKARLALAWVQFHEALGAE